MASSAAAASVAAPREARGFAPRQDGQQKSSRQAKRRWQHGDQNKKRLRKRERDMKGGTHEDVLALDIKALLASLGVDQSTSPEEALPEEGNEIEVDVLELSSTGDGLAQQEGSSRVYAVPFAIPGDTVKVKVFRHMHEGYSMADFLSIIKPSSSRDDSRIQCQYFAKCAGCQFQMLDYAEQLRLKKRVVEKAFKNFSQLPPELIPEIQNTIGSPLQYGYRTKLTPHFDGPPGYKNRKPLSSLPPFGFMPKGRRTTMDIEDCPIGTDVVRLGLKQQRQKLALEYSKYTSGATILLRESTKRIPKDSSSPSIPMEDEDCVKVETDSHIDVKVCVTNDNATSTEYVGDYLFTNRAGSFFQNNNSVLAPFTEYVRRRILPKDDVKYLIDAYSGSGLFTITLSSLFQGSIGIDVDPKGIEYARKNAANNGLPDSQCTFIAADARELFKSVKYPADETVVVLDPPRKGCDESFLSQLLRFGPRRILYVSCNVHTQARDVGVLVRGETKGVDGESQNGKKVRYEIESLVGFDFFPQTAHVEGVAVLNRIEELLAHDGKTAESAREPTIT